MSTFVKICGLANASDVQAVADLEPDAMGFVLYPKSARGVTAEQVGEWTEDLPAGILKVGVTVDASPEENIRWAEEAGLDVLQLHGSETDWSWCPPLTEIWKVARVEHPLPEQDGLAALLVDSHLPGLPGGTGVTADWNKAREIVETLDGSCRVLLAGGLVPGNVADAIERVQPWGVDVSSGVELEPGRKDLAKVRDFIANARNA